MMSGLEFVLTATFVAVWLVPLALALRWERRLLRARRDQRRPQDADVHPQASSSWARLEARVGDR